MVANGNVVCGPFTDDNEINNNNCAVKRFQYRLVIFIETIVRRD
jgi:hypothetical protein